MTRSDGRANSSATHLKSSDKIRGSGYRGRRLQSPGNDAMKRRMKPVAHKLLSALALLAVSPAALAYLDPSTGSMILSAIIGVLATMALAVKTYWYRLKAFFRGDRRQELPADKQEPSEGETSTES